MTGTVIRCGGADGFFRWLAFGAALFEREEAEGEQHEGGVVVEATPASAPEVIQAESFLHLQVALLDLPTFAPEPHRFDA